VAPSHFSVRAIERSLSNSAGGDAPRPFLVTGNGERGLLISGFCCHETLPLVLATFKGLPNAYLFRAAPVESEDNAHTMGSAVRYTMSRV
jgi:hypothetical protein